MCAWITEVWITRGKASIESWHMKRRKEKLWKIFSGCNNMNWTDSDFFGDKLMLNSLWRMMIIGTHYHYSLQIISPNSRCIAAPAPPSETIRCLTIISCGKKKVQKCRSTSVFWHRQDFISWAGCWLAHSRQGQSQMSCQEYFEYLKWIKLLFRKSYNVK